MTTDIDVRALVDAAAQAPGNDAETFGLVWRAAQAAGQVSAELAADPTARLWFTAWRIDPGPTVLAREAAWTAAAEPTSIDTPVGRVVGWTAGTGPTVLLVHGWGDYSARLGAFLQPLADRGLRALAVDLPGHGRSDADPTDLYRMSDAVASVVRTESVSAIVAHSMGSIASLRAVAGQSAVQALALLAPPLDLETAVPTFGRLFDLPPASLTGLCEWIERRYGPGVWDEFRAEMLAAACRVPTVLVHSRDDDQVDVASARTLVRAFPDAWLHEVDDLGHTRVVREPSILDVVADFVQSRVHDESR